MELTFECPHCRMIDHTDGVESASEALCRHCLKSRPLRPGSFDATGAPLGCPVCGGAHLYLRKDFPQGLGLAIVLSGFAAASAFWYHGSPLTAYLALGVALLADAVLYRWAPGVLGCYGGGGQLRGPGVDRGGRFRPFDASIAERAGRDRARAGSVPAPVAPPSAPEEPQRLASDAP